MRATTLANWESKLRPLVTKLPPQIVVLRYSSGRLDFLTKLKEDIPSETYTPLENLSREFWGIRFRAPIMNSAGMFKNGECYEMVFLKQLGNLVNHLFAQSVKARIGINRENEK